MAEHTKPDPRVHVGDLSPASIALLKDVSEEAAEKAVKKMLIAMGFDPDNPREAQADMLFLRETRKRCEAVADKTIVTVIGILVVAALGLLWVGFKSHFK